jgi:hypothetical protein
MSTHHQDWIPSNHEARYDQAVQAWTYLSNPKNRNRMGFVAGTVQGAWLDREVTSKYNVFLAAFQDWKKPAERTPTKSVELKEVEDEFVTVYKHVHTRFLKNNHLGANDDLQSRGMPLRNSSRIPVRIPDRNPDADPSYLRRMKISFYASDGTYRQGKPDGVHGSEIIREVCDALREVYLDDPIHSSFDTRMLFVLEFSDEQCGKVFYFAFLRENTRGEKGSFGPILNAIIP